ncbi:hypothetical protein PLIP_a0090 [Pseudoalteromonas lipolytica LMEB 39]|nr:hypothetical protein [Pseudoalteromonas lipolytica LMEB 39]
MHHECFNVVKSTVVTCKLYVRSGDYPTITTALATKLFT